MENSTFHGNNCENCGSSLTDAVNGSVTCHYCNSVYNIEPAHKPQSLTINVNVVTDSVPNAQMPYDNASLIPSRTDILKKCIKLGALAWLGYGLLRAVLGTSVPDMQVDSTTYDNIFISPIGGIYWVLRAVLFLLVFPGLISNIFYGRFISKYCDIENQLINKP